MSRSINVAILLAASGLFLGCGGGFKADRGVTVKGKLTKGGAPVTVPNMESKAGSVRVALFPVHTSIQDDRGAEGTLGGMDGTFEIIGAGKGVKAGKYKLSVVADPGDGIDQLGGKFDGATSPIDVELTDKEVGGVKDLGTIDLDSFK